mgnify:FL=1
MLLAIDVGNTHIVTGVFDGDVLKNQWRMATDPRRTADEYGVFLRQLFDSSGISVTQIDGAIMACVVPSLVIVMQQLCRKFLGLELMVLGPGMKSGIQIVYDNPREVGADRVANAAGAQALYGGNIIAVDFGTATTFDCITEDGRYIGGAISPGIGISAEALYRAAAKLPRVELSAPENPIGKNTVDSIRSGLLYGYAAMVDGMVRRLSEHFSGKPKVIATGGFTPLLMPLCETLEEAAPDLTLEGLRIIHERNRKTTGKPTR